jgi:Spy/CpxP family protein refolding chaperone
MALVAAFAALTGATALHAQGGGNPGDGRGRGPGGRGGMMMEQQLLQNITLTDAQKAKLEDLRKAERERMQAQRGQGGNSTFEQMREAREKGDSVAMRQLMEKQRAEMDARRDEQIASIRAVLTQDQYAQFDANVAELKKREAERGPGMRGRGPRPPRI